MIKKKTKYRPLYNTEMWCDTREGALRYDIDWITRSSSPNTKQALREILNHQAAHVEWVTEDGRRYDDRTSAVCAAVCALSPSQLLARRAEVIELLDGLEDFGEYERC